MINIENLENEELTEEEKLIIFSTCPQSFSRIKNPSKELIWAAISYDIYNIRYINPTEEITKYVISKDPRTIKYIRNTSEELQLLAIKLGRFTAQEIDSYISNPSPLVEFYKYSKGIQK